jgi:hypothetical protein
MDVTKPISLNVPKALTISFDTRVSYPTLPYLLAFAVAVKAGKTPEQAFSGSSCH